MKVLRPLLPVLFASLAMGPEMLGQVAVTDIAYGTATNGSNQNWGGITTDERFSPVSQVTTSLGGYQFNGPLATSVIARRNTNSSGGGGQNQNNDNPNNTTIIYQVDASDRAYGTKETSLQDVFLSGNVYT
jgi:hypothetical protein